MRGDGVVDERANSLGLKMLLQTVAMWTQDWKDVVYVIASDGLW